MSPNSQTVPGKPTSLWLDTTPDSRFPEISSEGVTVDVAIIGGGLAGLTAAVLLKEAGKTVAVLEARRIVQGVTGHTTAKVASQHGLIYDYLISHFGEEKARAYANANQAAIEQIASLVDTHKIDCDFNRAAAHVYTESVEEVEKLEAEAAAAIKLGLPASLVTETELPYPVAAAVRFDNQARFHPRKYLLALAEGIPGNGSYIFEETRVLDVEEGDPCTITTSQAKVTARDVIIATNVPVIDPALYFARMSPHYSYVLAARLNGAPPSDMYIDSNESYSVRSHPEADGGELLFVGGEGHKTGQGGDTVARYQRLEQWARDRFSVAEIAYHWSTQDFRTFDRVPFVGSASPTTKHLYVATGFGGWGMTNCTAAGMLLRDLILGQENPWADVYDPNRFNLASVPDFVKENLNAAKHLIGDRITHAESAQVAPGEGAVVETEHGKVALYKAENGDVHALSPACTHIGCIVAWNGAEKTWDCPCHGSRFACDGEVLHGPAIKSLSAVEVVLESADESDSTRAQSQARPD